MNTVSPAMVIAATQDPELADTGGIMTIAAVIAVSMLLSAWKITHGGGSYLLQAIAFFFGIIPMIGLGIAAGSWLSITFGVLLLVFMIGTIISDYRHHHGHGHHGHH